MPALRFRRLALVAALTAVAARSSAAAQATNTVLVTATPTGDQSTGIVVDKGAATPDARYVAFGASDSDLLPGDTNGLQDVFVRDLETSTTERIEALGGAQPNGQSHSPVISDDGRYVAFTSEASNLVTGDLNSKVDVFRYDRWTGQMVLVSTSSSGAQGDGHSSLRVDRSMSGDGRYIVFESTSTSFSGTPGNIQHIWRKDLSTGALMGVSASLQGVPGNDGSSDSVLSRDGRFCAFSSLADNLVPGDTNGVSDIFVRDLVTGVVVRASVGSNGVQANASSGDVYLTMSRDGRYVLFASEATNLVPGDTNGVRDSFRRDLVTAQTTRVSVGTGSIQGDGAAEHYLELSEDGRFALFWSEATNLVPPLTVSSAYRTYRRDIDGDATTLVAGNEADPLSAWPTFHPAAMVDGNRAVYAGLGDDIIPGIPSNGFYQLYLRDLDLCDTPVVYCVAKPNSKGCLPAIGWTGSPSLTTGGNLRIQASQVLSSTLGLLFYGEGQAFYPFFGGVGCVTLPFTRTTVQNSGGSAGGVDCSGAFTFDFTAYALSGIDPTLIPGQRVCAQYWYRDVASTFGSGLTNAIDWILCP
jgi:Tol biopolymer transport system component